jgi:hypothetical protein
MAKIYRHPAEAGDPPAYNPDLGFEQHLAAENAWIAKVQELARAQADNPEVVGQQVSFPRGDGYACYVVWRAKPLQLVHLPVGDAWHIDPAHARGLRLSDLEVQFRRNKALLAGRPV